MKIEQNIVRKPQLKRGFWHRTPQEWVKNRKYDRFPHGKFYELSSKIWSMEMALRKYVGTVNSFL